MGLHLIKKGLNIPLNGKPEQKISGEKYSTTYALLGSDYIGMKPTMIVNEGDVVKTGQLLFTDKKMPEVGYTSPVNGKIVRINRGEKRVFVSIEIQETGKDEITFQSFSENELMNLGYDSTKNLLLESGLWTSLRTRPFSKVADPNHKPHSVFVTAIDTNPLAPSMEKILEGKEKAFLNGLKVLTNLTDGKVFLCKNKDEKIPTLDSDKVSVEEFSGPHPAGLVGTHIHFLDPVSRHRHVWHIGLQDVISIGILFTTGKLNLERVISLAGPQVKNPKLIKTKVGVSLSEIVKDELKEGENRVISGSVLSGFKAEGNISYLGRYHQQVSVLKEGRERKFLGWISIGGEIYSAKNVVLSKLMPNRLLNLTTDKNGGHRAIVPNGSFEQVMPLDFEITSFLRTIAIKDVEEAEKLGVFELDEEDLALCTFVCPSKNEYGPMLRENLSLIEKEG
ncbi:MAG: Na(+)-translocating NADH-quinone reductase subunit A [Ignavibacteriales bacterium]